MREIILGFGDFYEDLFHNLNWLIHNFGHGFGYFLGVAFLILIVLAIAGALTSK